MRWTILPYLVSHNMILLLFEKFGFSFNEIYCYFPTLESSANGRFVYCWLENMKSLLVGYGGLFKAELFSVF